MESKRIVPVSHFDVVEVLKGDKLSASVPVRAARDGFSLYMRGRLAEDLPLYAQRVDAYCGITQYLAALGALDNCYQASPSEKALGIRRALAYVGVFFHHLQQLFLSRPSGCDGISGLVSTDDPIAASDVFSALNGAGEVISILGGRGITPERGIPGGLTKGITEEELTSAKDTAESLLSLTLQVEEVFRASNAKWVKDQKVSTPAYSLAMPDNIGSFSLDDGTLRIVDPQGSEFAKGAAKKILKKVAEWKEDLPLRVGPLARLNIGCVPSTPEAKRSQEQLLEALGKPPIHLAAAGHWAMVVELVEAAELLGQQLEQLETGDSDINSPLKEPVEGIAAMEGACGTVIHRYVLDEQGLVSEAQIAPTGQVLTSEVDAALCAVVNGNKQNVTDKTVGQIADVVGAYQPAFVPQAEFSLLINMRDEEGKMIKQWRKP